MRFEHRDEELDRIISEICYTHRNTSGVLEISKVVDRMKTA